MGHAGHPNHSSSRARLLNSLPWVAVSTRRQRHRSSCHASMAASTVTMASITAQRRRRSEGVAGAQATSALPTPSKAASAGRAGQGEPHHAHHHGHGRRHGVVGQGGHGKEDQRGACKLHQIARGFVRKLCQTQAGNQGQQGAIGDGAGIVRGLGLAAKGKRHRLGTRTARQVVNAVPGCCQRQHQQRHERQSRRHFGGHQPSGVIWMAQAPSQ
jgi:hypothetical protein